MCLFEPVLKLALAPFRGVLELAWAVFAHLSSFMHLSWDCHWLSLAIFALFLSFLGLALCLSLVLWACHGLALDLRKNGPKNR